MSSIYKKVILVIGLIALLVISVLAVNYFKMPSPSLKDRPNVVVNSGVVSGVSGVSSAVKQIFETADEAAKLWDAEAKLVNIEKSKDALGSFIETSKFSSINKKGKGYEVSIQGGKIISQKEIDFNWEGGDFKNDNANLISEQDAINTLREIPGHENDEILSSELRYDEIDKNWYYSLKTSKGVMSIKASK